LFNNVFGIRSFLVLMKCKLAHDKGESECRFSRCGAEGGSEFSTLISVDLDHLIHYDVCRCKEKDATCSDLGPTFDLVTRWMFSHLWIYVFVGDQIVHKKIPCFDFGSEWSDHEHCSYSALVVPNLNPLACRVYT
jgi:hypothetical protein